MNKIRTYKDLHWTKELIGRFWDYTSQYPVVNHSTIYGDAILRKLKRKVPHKGNIIDYGGYVGGIILSLLKDGFNTTLIDQSNEVLAKVNKKYEKYSNFMGAFHIDDISSVKNSADAILMTEVLEHMYDEELEKTLNNAKDLLSDFGMLLITVPNDEDLASNQVYCPQCDHVRHAMQHVRKWDVNSLKKYLQESGFEVNSIKATHILPNLNIFWSKRFFLGAILILAKKVFLKKPPHIVAIATKK
jgi:2-polyprenyl-3-methyl-5-hydroxy-6-metoxy-1,4-benzoquinol methylase